MITPRISYTLGLLIIARPSAMIDATIQSIRSVLFFLLGLIGVAGRFGFFQAKRAYLPSHVLTSIGNYVFEWYFVRVCDASTLDDQKEPHMFRFKLVALLSCFVVVIL